MKRIVVYFQLASSPKEYTNVLNTYEKGGMFCVLFADDSGKKKVHKYPLNSIFRVEEDY